MTQKMDILRRLRRGAAWLLLGVGLAWALSFGLGRDLPEALTFVIGLSLLSILLLLQVFILVGARLERGKLRTIMTFLDADRAPCFCADPSGRIVVQNEAALIRFGDNKGAPVAAALERLFANPVAVVHRLRQTLQETEFAREEVVTRRGNVRLAVHNVPGGQVWRFDDLVDRPSRVGDGLALPILTFGPSGTILYMNEVLRSLIGQRAKRLRDIFEVLPLENGRLNRLRAKDGPHSVRVMLSNAVSGRQEVFILPAADENSEAQVALEPLPVALLRLDAEGRILFANRLARDLLPAAQTTTERRLAAMVEGLGRSVGEWVSEAAEGRGLYRPEVVRVTGAATETYLQVTLGRPIGDGDGGLLAVLNDATELKTLEAQFVQSQKMQAIGQLAGGVAHDFNNLLTAISGHCDLLMLRHGEGDEDFPDLMQITQNANRAAALVGQLLAFSRKQTLEMRPVDLRDTLSDLTHLLNRLVGERVTLRLEHDPALIPIRGDRRQLEQVLMNLVVNARDAMPEGGEIRIRTECRYLSKPLARDRVIMPIGQYVVVKVADEGTGISPEVIDRIFEPFVTTKRPGEGTGLGLSMAYGIMKQSGGYIFAESQLGVGSEFSLFFPARETGEARPAAVSKDLEILQTPVVPEPAAALPDAPPAADDLAACVASAVSAAAAEPGDERETDIETAEVQDDSRGEAPPSATQDVLLLGDPVPKVQARGKAVVLLVEDEAPVRAFASRALRLRGYDVLEAEDAEAALDRLSDSSLNVDLFVTDVIMPGLDGPTWVRKAMKTRPDVRTVFISGYTQDAMSETTSPIPNSTFLAKPFSLSALTRTVEQALT